MATLSQTDGPLETLRTTPTKIAALLLDRRRRKHKIDSDTMISALAVAQRTQQLQADTVAALDTLEQAAQEAKARVDSVLAALLAAPLAGDPVLAELRAQRAWDRQRTLLAGGWDWQVLITRAATAGDRPLLAVLRQELPAWLEGRAGGDTEMALNQVAAANESIDRAEYPLLTDPERAARALAAEVAIGYSNVLTAFNYARAELTGEWEQASYIPDWAKGSTISVSETLNLHDRAKGTTETLNA
jgi:hypothetical protein